MGSSRGSLEAPRSMGWMIVIPPPTPPCVCLAANLNASFSTCFRFEVIDLAPAGKAEVSLNGGTSLCGCGTGSYRQPLRTELRLSSRTPYFAEARMQRR